MQDLEQVVADQNARFVVRDTGIVRDIEFERYLAHPALVVISGIRRCGKSTLLSQFSRYYIDWGYVNFDDDRFIPFTAGDFQSLLTVLLKRNPKARTFFFDEIQNIPGWERFVRRLHDEGYKIFITGSNAHLFSSELGTHLTGRYVKIELWPFSFPELLTYHHLSLDEITTQVRAATLHELDQYLDTGGFPEYVIYRESEFVRRTYEDILYRDVVARYGIRDIKALRTLGHYLMTNFTSEFTYRSLQQVCSLGSDSTVKHFISYLSDAYLLFECFPFNFSLKRQYQNAKKIYVIDSGMRNQISLKFSDDRGRLLENQVYIDLLRHGYEVWYFKGRGECDFVVRNSGGFFCIQVCAELSPDNADREISGLREAMEYLQVHEGVIITINQREYQFSEGSEEERIRLIPAWEWFTTRSG